jgi:hypothetical protein
MATPPSVFGGPTFGQTNLSASGSSQATAALLGAMLNVFTTVGSGQGCMLPVAQASVTVINAGANALSVYPPPGDQIDTNGANAAVSLPVGAGITVTCGDQVTQSPRTWRTTGNNLTNGGQIAGPLALGGPAATGAILSTTNSATQPTSDVQYISLTSSGSYTANSSSGANLGLVSTLYIYANGFHYSATHSAALYGTTSLADTNAASLVDFISGVEGAAGNAGAGTVTSVASFRAHSSFNTGGGTVTNSYAIYHEPDTIATNQYGFYMARPSGIGIAGPTYNLHIQSSSAGMSATNGMAITFSGASANMTVTSTGTSIGSGYSVGAGSLSAVDIVAGIGATQQATTATSGFLWIGSSAGAPTGVPTHAAAGLIPVQADTTNNKLWLYINSAWKGVVVS